MSESESRKKTVALAVRMDEDERDTIREKAKDSGLTVSEFMRRAAMGRRTRSAVDSQVINELRRLGGLQKHLFTEGGGALSKEYADILVAIKEAILRVGDAGKGSAKN